MFRLKIEFKCEESMPKVFWLKNVLAFQAHSKYSPAVEHASLNVIPLFFKDVRPKNILAQGFRNLARELYVIIFPLFIECDNVTKTMHKCEGVTVTVEVEVRLYWL